MLFLFFPFAQSFRLSQLWNRVAPAEAPSSWCFVNDKLVELRLVLYR